MRYSQPSVALALLASLCLSTSVPALANSVTQPQTLAEATTAEATTAEAPTIVDVAAGNEAFKTLTAALKAADLVETLAGEGPFTVFAPTDDAFAALPEGTLDELLKPENKDKLVKILTYHVVSGDVTSDKIEAGDVSTVEGSTVAVEVDSSAGTVMVNEAKVIQPDVKASNGVIHVIDKVILPPDA